MRVELECGHVVWVTRDPFAHEPADPQKHVDPTAWCHKCDAAMVIGAYAKETVLV